MAKFASASKQSASVMKNLQGDVLKSVGTVRNYEQALTRVAEYAKSEKINGGLRAITPEKAIEYLTERGKNVGQKTLDMERQAIQCMMKNLTNKLDEKTTLTVVKSDFQQELKCRAYTETQVAMIAASQRENNSLSTQLAYSSGLRAHELLTLQLSTHRTADERPELTSKFSGRKGVLYTVEGKGGLIRNVIMPNDLSLKIESRKLDEPVKVNDRGVFYTQHYNINGGQKWSNSFSAASSRVLKHSNGAHGLRHTYAQERMHELQVSGLSRDSALETVSQELGHFRPEITETYLR